MSPPTVLLTFSIGPVHHFIAQARRISDVWAGSSLLSHLMGRAIEKARARGGEPVFPALGAGDEDVGIPNRVVCRVPLDRADEVAEAMQEAVEAEWEALVAHAVEVLAEKAKISPAPQIWSPSPAARPRQTDHVFDASWSWVPEEMGYAAAAAAGARRYSASRLYRPFVQVDQHGEKCALCGERTALPDGHRGRVRDAWERAEAEIHSEDDRRFFRFDQGRLCLVCLTKRLYTRSKKERRVYFAALDSFDVAARGEPDARKTAKGRKEQQPLDRERAPYVALIELDGDNMGKILSWGTNAIKGGDEGVERFQRELSQRLAGFARDLRPAQDPRDDLFRAQLDLDRLGIRSKAPEKKRPQLIYAGGDDVLVVCTPRDALPVARALRERYTAALAPLVDLLEEPERIQELTISGAILFAHGRYPAGMMLHDVHQLLEEKAKREAGRNALAIRLDKRSGVPVEVAFHWDQPASESPERHWPAALDGLVAEIEAGQLGSTLTFNLRTEERILTSAFGGSIERWRPWLEDRIGRSGVSDVRAGELAERITPFFVHEKAAALRIARFLGRERGDTTEKEERHEPS